MATYEDAVRQYQDLMARIGPTGGYLNGQYMQPTVAGSGGNWQLGDQGQFRGAPTNYGAGAFGAMSPNLGADQGNWNTGVPWRGQGSFNQPVDQFGNIRPNPNGGLYQDQYTPANRSGSAGIAPPPGGQQNAKGVVNGQQPDESQWDPLDPSARPSGMPLQWNGPQNGWQNSELYPQARGKDGTTESGSTQTSGGSSMGGYQLPSAQMARPSGGGGFTPAPSMPSGAVPGLAGSGIWQRPKPQAPTNPPTWGPGNPASQEGAYGTTGSTGRPGSTGGSQPPQMQPPPSNTDGSYGGSYGGSQAGGAGKWTGSFPNAGKQAGTPVNPNLFGQGALGGWNGTYGGGSGGIAPGGGNSLGGYGNGQVGGSSGGGYMPPSLSGGGAGIAPPGGGNSLIGGQGGSYGNLPPALQQQWGGLLAGLPRSGQYSSSTTTRMPTQRSMNITQQRYIY